MCGVVGVVATSDPPSLPSELLERLSHRGPDSRGGRQLLGSGAGCVLGHTRLRIIDLSPAADQPLSNETGDVWVSYNGEIYNYGELRYELESKGHVFKSRSDTEILVHLYEETRDISQMLNRLRGMFAFAIFDQRRGKLLLARDHLGIKPMYYCATPPGFFFGSEARTVGRFAGKTEPSADALVSYLMHGSVSGGAIFEGVEELPPGHFLAWVNGTYELNQWWSPQVRPVPELSNDAIRLVRAALNDGVARHLVADRPVGLFLSGGVDSRSVLRFASERGDVRTINVSFPEAEDDESYEAMKAAELFGSEHETVEVTGKEVELLLPDVLSSMDQPTSDGVNTWIVCKAAREAGLVVALSGLGGDELFGGYPSFGLVPKVALMQSILRAAPRALRHEAAKRMSNLVPGSRASRVLSNTGRGGQAAYESVRGFFATGPLGQGTPNQVGMNGSEPEDWADRVMLLELANYLPNQLLRDTDSMSMAHSIEVRVPLLDDVLVRVAMAMPAKTRNEPGKALLAKAAGLEGIGIKRPFTLPFDKWLRGPLRETVKHGLLSEDLPFSDLLESNLRRRVWDSFDSGRTHWSRPWGLAVLRLWPQANGFNW